MLHGSIFEREMQILYRAVNKYFPGWQYREYSQNDLAKALCHLYFASHRSGVREILYKSQLANIAYNIELIPGYNIIGTSPTTILDFGLPLKILKTFDQSTLIYKLYSETTINICAWYMSNMQIILVIIKFLLRNGITWKNFIVTMGF